MSNIDILKITENRKQFYLFPIPTKFSERTAYLDATDICFDAIRADRKNNYEAEEGPAYSIEAVRAHEYAAYVAQYATVETLNRFDTPKYTMVTNALTDDQMTRYSST